MLQLGLSGTPQVRRRWGGDRGCWGCGGWGGVGVAWGMPWGAIASLWVRQDSVDGHRETSCLQSWPKEDCPPKKSTSKLSWGCSPPPQNVHPCLGLVWGWECWRGCLGMLGRMMENLGSTAEQGGGHRATPGRRGAGGPPSQHLPPPPPQLWAHPSPRPCRLSQSLAIKTASLAEAENMADLIDGYCRLQGHLETSLIVFPRRGEHPGGGHRPRQGPHSYPPRALLRSLHGHGITRGLGVTPAETHQTHCTCGRAIARGGAGLGGKLPGSIRLRGGRLGNDRLPSSPQSGRRGSACRRSRPRE